MDEMVLDATYIVNRRFYLYGDLAYIYIPEYGLDLIAHGLALNNWLLDFVMSSVREAVEWLYKDFKQMWTIQNYKRMLKVIQAPVSLMYKAAVLLWNFKVCMQHGRQTQR